MHEMSIAAAIVDLVGDEQRKNEFSRVRSIHVVIGALSHVDPRALEFGFDAASKGTVADGAQLRIDRPSGTGYCTTCERKVTVASRADSCPSCGGDQWLLVSGDEMRVLDLEVE